MKTSQQDVLDRPTSQEPYLLVGSAFEAKGSVLAPKGPARKSPETKSAPKQSIEQARNLRVWASQQLAETQSAEGLVFQLLLASGVVLIVISFWL